MCGWASAIRDTRTGWAYVLSDFARSDRDWLDDLLRGIADGSPFLAAGDGGRFQNAVAARTQPARNTGRTGPDGAGSTKPSPGRTEGNPAPATEIEAAPASMAERLRALTRRFR